MTVAELVEKLESIAGWRDNAVVVIEGRLSDPNDVIQIHDVQMAIGVNGAEEIHLLAADGIRDRV
jgi:hypothetical protein